MCVICICMHALIGTWMCRRVHMCVEARGWHLASSLSPLIEPTYLASLGSRFAPGSLYLLLPTSEITGGFHIHLALPCMLETQMPVLMLAANNLSTGTVLHRHTPFCVNVSRRGSWGQRTTFRGWFSAYTRWVQRGNSGGRVQMYVFLPAEPCPPLSPDESYGE